MVQPEEAVLRKNDVKPMRMHVRVCPQSGYVNSRTQPGQGSVGRKTTLREKTRVRGENRRVAINNHSCSSNSVSVCRLLS